MSSNSFPRPARFEFRLDSVHNGLACGWVRDLKDPARRLQVTLMVDGELFVDWADIHRDELARPGVADVACGFRIEFGRNEFTTIALLVEGECLYAEAAPPATLPSAPQVIPDTDAIEVFAPGWRQRPLLFLFADQCWDPHPGRTRHLARALLASGWDVAWIEPVMRNMPGLRASPLEAGRICRITLGALPGQADLSRAHLDPALCDRWSAPLQALARHRPGHASLYSGARWLGLMQARPLEGPMVLDLDHDPCAPSPWRLQLGQLQAALKAADALSLASPTALTQPASRPCITLRNGFHPELLALACGQSERRYFFGASAVLERAQGARWIRDFLQAHPGLPAVVAGGGTLAPMFEQLAQTQPGVAFLGASPPMVAGFCLSRSRFALIAMGAQPGASPCAFYASLALGVPMLGPQLPDCEEELRAAFTAVPLGPVPVAQLQAAQSSFEPVRADIDLSRYSWDARAAQLLELLQALGAGGYSGNSKKISSAP